MTEEYNEDFIEPDLSKNNEEDTGASTLKQDIETKKGMIIFWDKEDTTKAAENIAKQLLYTDDESKQRYNLN